MAIIVHVHKRTADATEQQKKIAIQDFLIRSETKNRVVAEHWLRLNNWDPDDAYNAWNKAPFPNKVGDHRLDFVTPATDSERRERIQEVVRNVGCTSAVALRWLEAEEWIVDTTVRELKHAMKLGFTVDSPTAGQLAECKRLVQQLNEIINNEMFKRRTPEEADKVRQALRSALAVANS